MVHEGLIAKDEAVQRITGSHLDQLLHPRIDPSVIASAKLLASGLAASPVLRWAKWCSTPMRRPCRACMAARASKVILVRDETNPDDVHGMLAAQGVLTARGGKTSHAAVVARGFGIPCVAGAEAWK